MHVHVRISFQNAQDCQLQRTAYHPTQRGTHDCAPPLPDTSLTFARLLNLIQGVGE